MIDAESKIGYIFNNKKLLQCALSHSSYANEHRTKNNERLEFLGDSVLSIIISKRLYMDMPNDNEGVLSKIRSSLVCEGELAKVSEKIELGNLLLLGKGEEMTGGRNRASIISDAFEATLAAIYIDGGMEEAEKWLISLMEDEIVFAIKHKKVITDYKTALQKLVQKDGHGVVTYKVINEMGQDHNKYFVVSAIVNNEEKMSGEGKSKKSAEQMAARKTLEYYYNENI